MQHRTSAPQGGPSVAEALSPPTIGQLDQLRPIAAQLASEQVGSAWPQLVVVAVLLAGSAAAALASSATALKVGAAATMGVLLYAVDALQHEAVHGGLHRSARANRVLGVACSVTLLSVYSLYRAYHVEHHAKTAEPDDPEGTHVITSRLHLLLQPLVIGRFWVRQGGAAMGAAIGRGAPSYVRTPAQVRSIRVDLAVTASWLTALVAATIAHPELAWVWLVPAAVYVLGIYPYGHLYEHFGAEASGLVGERWNQASITRTIRVSRPIRWLLLSSTNHAAHHAFPRVPASGLPELQRHLAAITPPSMSDDGYLAFLRRAWAELPWLGRRGLIAKPDS